MLQHFEASGRWPHWPSLPVDQLGSELILQRLEHSRHGGLRAVQAASRRADPAFFKRPDECPQAIEVHMRKEHTPLRDEMRHSHSRIRIVHAARLYMRQ